MLEPFGESRGDLRMGILAAVVANYSGNAEQAVRPDDFIPQFQLRDTEVLDGRAADEAELNRLYAKLSRGK